MIYRAGIRSQVWPREVLVVVNCLTVWLRCLVIFGHAHLCELGPNYLWGSLPTPSTLRRVFIPAKAKDAIHGWELGMIRQWS